MQYFLLTLGCKVNQYESEEMRAQLEDAGYTQASDAEHADVCIINSCAVTVTAEKKCRQHVRRLLRANLRTRIVLTGCMAQRMGSSLSELSNRLIIIGNREKSALLEHLEIGPGCRVSPPPDSSIAYAGKGIKAYPERHRAIVKVQDGCNLFCTYCIIPHLRGALRSRPAQDVYAELQRLALAGHREVVLTGIHLGLYGEEEGNGLAALIEGIPKISGLARIRLSSVEPTDFSPSIIEAIVRDQRICSHLHIPLQHGDNGVLQAMGRRYTREEFMHLLAKLRKARPGLAVTTDLIVGFPGESEEAFDATRELAAAAGFAGIHVFRYSPRPGTPAALFKNQVPESIKTTRAGLMAEVAAAAGQAYARTLVGRTLQVVVEDTDHSRGIAVGRSDRYCEVAMPLSGSLHAGSLVDVKIAGFHKMQLLGKDPVKVI